MEEYITEIREYLPLEYQLKDNNDYIDYLITAFNKTSENGNYQFSFLAFHLLYMSFIYKVIRQSYDQDVKNIRKMIEQLESKIASYDNPFDLSVVPEIASFGLLKCFGFHKNKLDEFQSIIRHRDHVAHASGFIQYGENQVRRFIEDELNHIREIQDKSKELLFGIFESYFRRNFKLNDNYFPSGLDSIDKFAREHIMSLKDLEILVRDAPNFMNDASGDLTIIYKKVFYLLVAGKVDEWRNDETDYFLQLLPKLFIGFDKQQSITVNDLFTSEFVDILYELNDDDLRKLKNIFTENNIEYQIDYLSGV